MVQISVLVELGSVVLWTSACCIFFSGLIAGMSLGLSYRKSSVIILQCVWVALFLYVTVSYFGMAPSEG